jgi:hypothetical protein|tara:strand:+ start:102 stop:626 length:525 start_codon:yes stop_codon:yes gene_type:complete
MTAPKGTHAFTTDESAASEEELDQAISEVLTEPEFSKFSTRDSYSVNEWYGSAIASTDRGRDSMTSPDTGVLYYGDKVVGLGDNKYQHSHQNACERVCLYALDAIQKGLSLKRVFVVFAGEGFKESSPGKIKGSTGKMVVRAKHFTSLVNPTQEAMRTKYRDYLRIIVEEEALQ